MSLTHYKVHCSLDYNQREAYERENNTTLLWPRVTVNQRGEASVSTPNHDQHENHNDSLFYMTATTSHEGMVVAIETDYNVQLMSDVWGNITYAVVYEPNGPVGYGADRVREARQGGWDRGSRMFRRIPIGNTESLSDVFHATVDAPQDALEAWQVYKMALKYRKDQASYDAQQERILDARRHVEKGRTVRVTRGRKVPVGTEGKVFWIGNSPYGEKVGIAIPQDDGSYRMERRTGRNGSYESYADVAWTYMRNVEVINELGGRIL